MTFSAKKAVLLLLSGLNDISPLLPPLGKIRLATAPLEISTLASLCKKSFRRPCLQSQTNKSLGYTA